VTPADKMLFVGVMLWVLYVAVSETWRIRKKTREFKDKWK
jgi:hypothetical protein